MLPVAELGGSMGASANISALTTGAGEAVGAAGIGVAAPETVSSDGLVSRGAAAALASSLRVEFRDVIDTPAATAAAVTTNAAVNLLERRLGECSTIDAAVDSWSSVTDLVELGGEMLGKLNSASSGWMHCNSD